jgi:branched-chain amino acid transport system permease protein
MGAQMDVPTEAPDASVKRRRPGAAGPSSATLVRPTIYGGHQYRSVAAVVVLIAILVPLVFNSLTNTYQADLWLVYSVAAIGFYLVFGMAGRFAFCQPFSMALGAYVAAWMSRQVSNDWIGLVVAVAITAALMTAVGWAISRAQEFYFAVATLALSEVGLTVFTQWQSFTGPSGDVTDVPPISVFGYSMKSDSRVFWVFLAIFAVVLVLAVFIERSPLRRDVIAARDNPMVARTLGVPVARVQVLMFVVGSCFGALSGWMYAHWSGVLEPNSFGVNLAVGLFLMVVLGGMNTHWGAVIGALFYVEVPQLLSSLAAYQAIVYGSVLIVVIIAFPQGLAGLAQSLVKRRRLPHSKSPQTVQARGRFARLFHFWES